MGQQEQRVAGESMPVPGGEPLTSGPPVAHMVLSSPLTETPSQSPHWPPTPRPCCQRNTPPADPQPASPPGLPPPALITGAACSPPPPPAPRVGTPSDSSWPFPRLVWGLSGSLHTGHRAGSGGGQTTVHPAHPSTCFSVGTSMTTLGSVRGWGRGSV